MQLSILCIPKFLGAIYFGTRSIYPPAIKHTHLVSKLYTGIKMLLFPSPSLPLSLSPSLPLSPQWQMSPAFRLLFNGPLHRRATEGGRERSRDSSTRPPRPPQQKQRKVELFLGGIAVSNPPARSHRSAPLLASPLLSSPLVFPARRGVGSTEVGLNARTR